MNELSTKQLVYLGMRATDMFFCKCKEKKGEEMEKVSAPQAPQPKRPKDEAEVWDGPSTGSLFFESVA